MNSTPKTLLLSRVFLPFLTVLFSFGTAFYPEKALAQAVKFNWVSPPSAATTYSVGGASVTFNVTALDAGNTIVSSFNQPVTIALYDTATSILSDPKAVIVSGGVTYNNGIATPSFSSGSITFTLQWNTGSDSEQVSIYNSAGVTNATYPGSIGVTTGPGYMVKGNSQSYFAFDQSNGSLPATYSAGTTQYNQLVTAGTFSASPKMDQIPEGSSVSIAAAYVYTGLSAGYAHGGVQILPNIMVQKANNSVNPLVYYEVILDYGVTTPLTDFNNPRTYADTVFSNVSAPATIGGTFPVQITSGVTVSGYQPYQPFMQGGQVILRVWSQNSTSMGDPISIIYAANAPTSVTVASISIPYSNQNTLPVKAFFTGTTIVGNSSAATLKYVIKNQFSSGLTQVTYQIPNSPAPTSQYWGVSIITSSLAGFAATVTSQAGASGPGIITAYNAGATLGVGASVTLTMSVTVTDKSFSAWDFHLLSASSTGGPAPLDPTIPTVQTMGIPSAPQSFTATAANFTSTGGRLSLTWAQPATLEGATQYVVNRPPGGPGYPQTINGIGVTTTTDNSPNNLQGYTYTIYAQNAVTQSAPVTAAPNPVTAFANPGTPGPVTALTGGATIQLSWAAPASVSGSYAVTGYQVYKGTAPNGESSTPLTTVYSSAAAVTYNDMAVTAGFNYYYYLSAIDNQYSSGPTMSPHNSGPSAEVTGFPLGNPPTAATSLIYPGGATPATIVVSWTLPTNVLNSPITGYQVFKAQSSPVTSAYASFATVGAVTFVNDYNAPSTFANGTAYKYYVVAIDNKGVVSNSSATVLQGVGPSAPTGLTPYAASAAISFTWNANPGTENVVNYVLYRDSAPSPVASSGSTAAAVTDASPPSYGVNHVYNVAGVDNNGVTGPQSSSVTSARLPNAPTGVAVTFLSGSNSVSIRWTDPDTNLTNFVLYRQIDSGALGGISSPLAGVTSYTDAAPANAGSTVFYQLRANNIGGYSVTLSTPAGVQIPPNAPVSVTTSSSASAITVIWNARPASENVSSYKVYRIDPSGPTTTSPGTVASPTTLLSDGGVLAGKNYQYYVTATNPGGGGYPGGEGPPSASVTASLLVGPPASFAVTVQANNTSVNLTWSAPVSSGNLTGYNIYRNTTSSMPATAFTTLPVTLAYTDSGPTTANAGVTYFYWLQGQNNSGGGATTLQGVQLPPNPPMGLGAAPTTNSIPITWAANPGAEAVSFYTLYRGTAPNPTSVQATSILGTTYTDSTPSTGTNYYYRLTATNTGSGATIAGGQSLYSAGNLLTGLLPQKPATITNQLLNTNNDIAVTWINVTGVDPNASSVTLFTNTNGVTTGATLTNITPASTTAVTQLAQNPDTTYYYWLRTNNAFGSGPLAGPVSTLTYPAAVSLVSAAPDPDGTSRDLSWVTVGGGDVNQYNIYREQLGASSFVSLGFASATGLTFPFKSTSPVLPGKSYIYKITAANNTGEGTNANFVTIGISPSVPVSVTAVSGVSNAGVTVNLAWADPNAVSEGVTAFTVYKATTLTGTYSSVASGITGTSYSDGAVTGAGVYYYILAADNNAGKESPVTYTNAVAVTAFALPNPATGVTAVAGTSQAAVSWTAPANTTYPVSIYNAYSVSGGVTAATSPPSAVAAPLTDTGVVNGNNYFYLIRTMDSKGNLSAYSAPSSTVQPVATPSAPSPVNIGIGNNALQLTWGAGSQGTLPIGSYLIFRQQVPGAFAPLTQVSSLAYVDTGLTNGVTYNYYLESADNSGVTTGIHVSPPSVTIQGIPGTVAANPPSNVAATGGNGSIAVTWKDSYVAGAAVTGYQLWKSISGAAYSSITIIGSGIQNYTDSAVTNGGTYAYYFNAINNTGVTSINSAAVTAYPAAPPSMPSGVGLVDGSTSESVTWLANVPGASQRGIASYVVYRTGASSATVTVLSPAGSYPDSGLSNGASYIYQVAAIDLNGTLGPQSGPVTGYPFTLAAPPGISTSASSTAITLTWGLPGSTYPVTGYQILRGTAPGAESAFATVGAVTSLTDTPLTLDQFYYYKIVAIDNKSHFGTPSTEIFDAPVSQPAAPGNFVALAGDTQILLDWAPASAVTGALPVSEYIVTNLAGGSVTLPPTRTWYLDTTIVNGTPVTYTVQTVDSSGKTTGIHISVASAPASATGNSSNLNPPTALTAAAQGPNSIKLTWAPPNDQGKVVGSFYIFRSSTFSGGYSQIATVANPPLAPVTTYTDATASPNTTYYYLVQAYYTQPAPATASPNSNHASATTPVSPVPPKVLAASTMAFDANLLLPLTGQKLGIAYVTPNTGDVEIDIYNIAGNVIRYLYPGVATANTQTTTSWDGKDRNGNVVASGLYFIEIKAPGFHQVKKVAVVK